MLLNELTGVKAFAKMTAKEVLSVLNGHFGIKEVGRGSFGIVLAHPSWDYVIKFFAKDDCYMKFVDYCLKNKSNEHLPKFVKKPVKLSAFFKHPEEIDSFWAVKIEKLNELDDDTAQITDIFCDDDFVDRYQSAKNPDLFLQRYKNKIGVPGPNLLQYKSFADTVTEVSTMHIGADCFIDIHDRNIMLRGKTMVLMDPFADNHMGENTELSVLLMKAMSSRSDLVSRKVTKDEVEDMASSIAKVIK